MHWIRPHASLAPLPGRFASVALVGRDDPDRVELENFIAGIYRDRYGARLRSFLPHLLAYRDGEGRLSAAVGLRAGGEGRLFAEQYLDGPVERVMAWREIARVDRRAVAEVGNFAASTPGIARELILQLAMLLQSAGMEWVLFVATRQLRNALQRLRLPTIELAEARVERLRGGGDWGTYYASRPRLVCGNLAEGVAYLGATQPAEDPGAAPTVCLAGVR
ncbi:thermostable hemolysin [Luteimonas sp. SJ-92]|uniref:Thermostable hemolysin n=1 Tax=Luteimonas salinisoli TaxID=2752307 RepID=A0A853JEU5_9GAMM|nr:thermostable hemolysin [Luteimonas salinisoli]NZA27861.1 thermostable hemolysin [Luteimonas salinisoli]